MQFIYSIICVNIATKLIFLHLYLPPNVFDRTSRGEWVHESHDQNTQLNCVCYQNLPYILLRHVFLSLSGPITALPGKINKGHMRSPMKNTWQRQLSFV